MNISGIFFFYSREYLLFSTIIDSWLQLEIYLLYLPYIETNFKKQYFAEFMF